MRSKCNSVARQNSGLVGRYRVVVEWRDVVIQRKCKGSAQICILSIQSAVVAGFCDWEEFRKRKKRRQAMLKLLRVLRG